MKKKLFTIKLKLILWILLLVLMGKDAKASLYEFTANTEFYGMAVKSYVNNYEAGYWSGSLGHNMPAQGVSLWNVDAKNMETTMYNLSVSIDSPQILSDTVIYQEGFGNTIYIPFVLTITDFTSSINSHYGPFAIANDLTFDGILDPVAKTDFTMNAEGFIDVNGERINFNLTNQPWSDNRILQAQFDDTFFPDNLMMNVLNRSFRWDNADYFKVAETVINGRVVEFHLNPHVLEFETFEGILVPEPATIALFAFGGLLLRRKFKP